MRKRVIVPVLAAAALAAPAAAHDHRVPNVALELGDVVQEGRLVESAWLRAAQDGSGDCVAEFADGFGWPPALRSRASGSTAVLHLRKPQPPMELELLAGREADAQGEPQTLVPWPFVLRPRPGAQPQSWELVVPLPASEHVFFQLEASWRDEDECGGAPDLGDQYGVWRFHVHRRETPFRACTRRRVETLVSDFVRAYNRGDSQTLERVWAQEPDFRWYFVQDERHSGEAEDRATLGAYFAERHVLGDRIHLRSLRVGPPNDEGFFGVGYRLRRSSHQPAARGMWHGKASATKVDSGTCALVVWSMGRE